MDANCNSEAPQETSSVEIKSFFNSAPPLKDAGDISGKLKDFIQRNSLSSGTFTVYFQSAIYVYLTFSFCGVILSNVY